MNEDFLKKVAILLLGNFVGLTWLGGVTFGVLGAMVGFMISIPITSMMISAMIS